MMMIRSEQIKRPHTHRYTIHPEGHRHGVIIIIVIIILLLLHSNEAQFVSYK